MADWKRYYTGLIEGVKSKASSLIEGVRGVVNDAIQEAKNLLGIASPSKVFEEIGMNTGEGFAKGMASMVRYIQQVSDQLVQASIPDVPSISGATGANSSNVVNNTYNLAGLLSGANITVRSDNDIKRLAQELGDYIAQQGRGVGVTSF